MILRLVLPTVLLAVLPSPVDVGLPRVESVTPAGRRLGYLRFAGTDTKFVPRGANYIRLHEFQQEVYHSTFEPGQYDAVRAEGALTALSHDGYNTVRVFIDPGSIPAAQAGHAHGLGRGVDDNEPIYAPYMDNVADFVGRAGAHRIYVMFALDAFPQNQFYYSLVGATDRTQIDGNNLFYLHPGMHKAKAAYMTNFVSALHQRIGDSGMSTVLAYATDNEAFVVGDKAPFSLKSGQVATAAGAYDMAKPDQRQQAQDANLVAYANSMADAARAADPAAMVTMGAFTYAAVGKPGPAGLPIRCSTDCQPNVDYRYPARPGKLSGLSFLDLHIYPDGRADSLERNLTSIEWNDVHGTVILGEHGAFKEFHGNNITRAAYAMRDLQVATCGRGMVGWLFWTWDTTETADQRRLFTLTESGGAINGQLAPIARPNPCKT